MNSRSFLTNTSLLGSAAMAMAVPAVAFAQNSGAGTTVADPAGATNTPSDTGDNGEIVVTAQRRQERAVDVPITITSLSAETLATANVQQLSDISKITPGLRFDAQGTFVQPTIRGVGTAVTTSGGGPNVGIYVDGFYVANPEAGSFDLMRIQSVQVLKGPQGTLFGRNTTGGAILLTTADPSTETHVEAKASYGSFNAVALQGYGTTGFGDVLAVDLEGLYRRGDGYFTNIVNGDDRVGRYENWSVRAGAKAFIGDNVTAMFRYTHSDTNDPTALLTNGYIDRNGESGFLTSFVSPAGRAINQAAFGRTDTVGLPLVNLGVYAFVPGAVATRPGEVATAPDLPNSFVNVSDIYQGTIKADLGFADLTSYTQYRTDSAVNLQDLDKTAVPIFNIYIGVENRLFTQEMLLTSKPGSRLQWTAGLYYFRNRDTFVIKAAGLAATRFYPTTAVTDYSPFGGSSTLTQSYAGFFDATYEITPSLFVTAGGRYSHDQVSDAYTIIPVAQIALSANDYSANSFTPRVAIRYKPSEQSSIYASWTRGYKAGLINVGAGDVNVANNPVQPEKIDAFEIGYKYDDRTLSLDLSAYYYKYSNLQVSSFQSGLALINNAASARIYGAEAAIRYRVSDSFDVSAGAAYTNARYEDFAPNATSPGAPFYTYCDPAAGPGSNVVCDPAGPAGAGGLAQTFGNGTNLQLQRAPKFTANLAATYRTPLAGGNLKLGANLYYTSKFYFAPAQQFYQDAYATVSARAQWEDRSERFTVAVYGDNLTGKRYLTQAQYNAIGIGSSWSPPATWGVQLGFKY
jgi:iron complex outermembrane recepter protein